MTDPLLFMCSYDVFLCLILCNIFYCTDNLLLYTTGSVYIVIIIITNNN